MLTPSTVLRELAGGARFSVRRILGSGAGTGVVYEALDALGGQLVALKELGPRNLAAASALRADFRVLSRLSHPNIGRVLDLVEIDGSFLVATELVDGGDVLGVKGASALRVALAQAARGLLALHAAGRIHGNLKPSNVRQFARDARVVVLDAGALGTPLAAYTAPEQMELDAVAGPPADWYALGAILHEALTGKAPFAGTPEKVAEQKRAGTPVPVRQLTPDAPADLEALCLRLLQLEPACRPPGEEILRVLEAANAHPREAARPAEPVQLLQPPPLPRPAAPQLAPTPRTENRRRPDDDLPTPDKEFRGTQRFQVEERVGTGGMGMVYAVLDRERDMRVALKTLRQISPHGLYLFKNEFRALADIRHRNLVQLHELFCDDGLWFFTMELLRGEDLLAHVRAGLAPPFFDEARLRAALPQLVHGLMALHAAEKIHRDIKPSNVMVTTDGRVVVMDFGLVTETSTASEETLIGTPQYMAPEQVSGQNVGPAADWYALGVVLYQLLTGRFPFDGGYADLLEAKRTREPLPPAALSRGVPEDLSRLTADLLRTSAKARPGGHELLRRLGAEPVAVEKARAAAPTLAGPERRFVGRRAELRALHRAFEAVRAGTARGILVHGESGVGKSALVRHFVDELRTGRRALVLPGRCYEQETVPYKAFDGVVDAFSRELLYLDETTARELLIAEVGLVARLFPVLERVPAVRSVEPGRPRPTNPFVLRTEAFAALRAQFRHLSRRTTPVVVVDDLQWADQDSLALLSELLRPPSPPPFLLLVTMRGNPEVIREMGGPLAPLAPASESLEELQLRPLAEPDALLLARTLAGDERRAGELVRESGGHPLFLIELANRTNSPAAAGLPGASLDELLLRRSEALPAAAKHLLGMVAIAGGPLPQHVLALATGLSPAELANRVSELRSENLVRTEGLSGQSAIEPYHARVGEAVRRHLADPLRRSYHRALAAALEAGSVSTFGALRMLVTHLEATGELERAGRHAVRAADMAAQALAFDQAAELYRTAIRLVPARAPEAQQRLKVELARALDYAGRGAESARAYLEASAGALGEERRELRRKAAELLLASGHLDEGLTAVDEVLADFGEKLPVTGRDVVSALSWQRFQLQLRPRGLTYHPRPAAEIPREVLDRIDTFYAVQVGLSGVDNLRAFAFLTHGFRLALDAGEELRIARGMMLEGVNRTSLGTSRRSEALDLIARGKRIGERRADAYVCWLGLISEGMAFYYSGQFRESARMVAEGERMQREKLQHASAAVTKELGLARLLRLQALRMDGDLREMERSMLEYVGDAVARGDLFSEVSFVRGCAFRHLLADAPELALEDLQQKVWPPPRGHFHHQHWYSLCVRAEVALYGGEPTGRSFLADEFLALRKSVLPRIQVVRAEANWLWGRLCLLEAVSLPDRRAGALREVRRVARALESERVPYAAGLALLLRAGHATITGDRAEATQHLGTAREALEGLMALCAAAATYRLGQLDGSGALAEGEALLRALGVRQPARIAEVMVPGAFGAG